MAEIYEKFWDDAVESTIKLHEAAVPDVQTVVFLREVPTPAEYRPVNGDSIMLDRGGDVSIPWRSALSEDSAISDEVSALRFDEVVDAALQASGS